MTERVIISRTDSIGDVILTLPLAIALKQKNPGILIFFLGRKYTRAIIEACPAVDRFIDVDDLKNVSDWSALKADAILHVYPKSKLASMARKAGIPRRIGTSHRLFHWFTCNERINLGRKNSNLHEAQLNLKLGPPLGLSPDYSLEEIKTWQLLRKPGISAKVSALLHPEKVNIILHPRSRGSAREWGLANFSELISLLPSARFNILVSGTEEEGRGIRDWLENEPVTDITGKLSLPEFMELISNAQALVAASTGPLHIAAAMGIHALGVYAPIRPMHPGRWGPVGTHAEAFVRDKTCSDCRKDNDCHCIREVKAGEIADSLLKIRR